MISFLKDVLLSEVLYYFRRPSLKSFRTRAKNRNPFKGEAALSCQVANYLVAKTVEGKCRAVWTKIDNETSSSSWTYGIMMRAMGKNTGVADFYIGGKWGTLWLELKDDPKKKLSEGQKFFKKWCEQTEGVHYKMCVSLDEVKELLCSWEIVDGD